MNIRKCKCCGATGGQYFYYCCSQPTAIIRDYQKDDEHINELKSWED
jgi:hypothetical protein